MIAQDTGSAIVGPARADLYFGAGVDAGKVSGRLRHTVRFVMLVPKSLDPVERGRKLPLPDERPSEKIAKLFPQGDPLKDQPKEPSKEPIKDQAKAQSRDQKDAAPAPVSTTVAQATATVVPLPLPRPEIAPALELRHHHFRRYRHGR